MAQPYYPPGDQELEAWVADFLTNLLDVITALGLAATFDDALIAAKGTYSSDLSSHTAAQTASFTARQTKDASKAAMIAALRAIVNQLRANPNFTDAMAVSLGLPVYDTTPTPVQPGFEAPSVEVDTSHPQKHTVSVWQMGEEVGVSIPRPDWARAARIVHAIVATGQAAPPIEDMVYLASDTAPPYSWDIAGAHVGKDIWYRAAWESPRGEIGPWSDPAKGTVTG